MKKIISAIKRLCLLLLSGLFAAVVYVRNKLFDKGVLKSVSFSIPTISIGNITVGGTGKTPHTAMLCEALAMRYRVAVLSRGYGRRTRGFRMVTETSTAAEAGDEPCMLKNRYPGVTVAVDERRVDGMQQLLRQSEPPELVLLDDAFQHRYIRPAYSILLVDYNRPLDQDTYLPLGRMRESFSGRLRADMVVLTKTPPDFTEAQLQQCRARLRLPNRIPLLATSLRYGPWRPLFPDANPHGVNGLTADMLRRSSVLVVTAIAAPEPLFAYLHTQVGRVETLTYPDHHAFTAADAAEVMNRFEELQDRLRYIITTEKDAIRWRAVSMPGRLRRSMYYIPVDVVFPLQDKAHFMNLIAAALSRYNVHVRV